MPLKNTRQKGNRNVNRAMEYFASEGFLMDKVEKTGKWVVEKDLYGLFDLTGVAKNKCIFVQVKSNNPPTKKPYVEFAQTYGGNNLLVADYTWYDRAGPVIRYYDCNGSVTTTDLRR